MKTKVNEIVKLNGVLGKAVKCYGDKKVLRFLPSNYGSYSHYELEELSDIPYDMIKTDHKEKVEYLVENYTWGKVNEVHCIGEYQILEYVDSEDSVSFHSYINYDDTCNSFPSLDEALIGCIVFKKVGKNSRLEHYIPKMLED